MRCIFGHHVNTVLGEMWAMFKAVLKQFTILLPLFVLKVAFSTGDIIYLPIIIRRLHALCYYAVYIFRKRIKKRKLKLKLSWALFQPTTKYHWVTHTHRHTHRRRCYLTRMTRRPPVRPTLSSTRSGVPAKFLST